MARVTIKDVAKAAGVSIGTCSRVINDHPSVNAETRRRVMETIDRLGYVPNAVAQSMRSRLTRSVACIVRDLKMAAFASFVELAQAVLFENGFTLFVACSSGDRNRELQMLRLFNRRQIDGVIAALQDETEGSEAEEALRLLGPAVVVLEREHPAWADAVMVEQRNGVMNATEHLLQLGHRRIALITGSPHLSPARERILGYKQALDQHGISVSDDLVCTGSFLPEFGYSKSLELLSRDDPPTAIISGGMAMLPGVLRAVRSLGLTVPDDVSIVAGCDVELAELASPSISTIRWNLGEAGRVAANLILNRLNGNVHGKPVRMTIPTEFVARELTMSPNRLSSRSRRIRRR